MQWNLKCRSSSAACLLDCTPHPSPCLPHPTLQCAGHAGVSQRCEPRARGLYGAGGAGDQPVRGGVWGQGRERMDGCCAMGVWAASVANGRRWGWCGLHCIVSRAFDPCCAGAPCCRLEDQVESRGGRMVFTRGSLAVSALVATEPACLPACLPCLCLSAVMHPCLLPPSPSTLPSLTPPPPRLPAGQPPPGHPGRGAPAGRQTPRGQGRFHPGPRRKGAGRRGDDHWRPPAGA